MIVRLLLAVLLAWGVLPAPAAACHAPPAGAAVATAHGGAHPSPSPEQPAPEHACIGCVPPAAPARVAAGSAPPPMVLAASTIARLDLRGGAAPVTPPPRG